ncbi:MAG: electron transfer flavoprotein subunit beta/FixA family protein [Alphaproteobacteria bacterium]|jgi:electron transfer flavoprotein beta subunit|nr:electron transfer flavoprotein subunit beta/FixA family protein [Alphaproteobacteria bacterium]MDP6589010.1 electron transfer flavoprotein subunit beta/FixA family protein [Alphaproteobacteria bacterium]MDP6819454.1 electron transfer flavoprotein subunit beta/FixA family protein [Alphaproteobacteria bacterium]
MKVLVGIKRTIDANVKVRVKADESGVETANVKMTINPFCEIAVEEAVRMKEAGIAEEVVVVTAGPEEARQTLMTALAIGADRAVHVVAEQDIQPLGVAKALKAVVEQESPGLVIVGKQAIDDDSNQTGQMLAALLGWPQATFASKITLGDGEAEVTREIDGGLETLTIKLPAVVTTDLRLNEPRYASLPNIMKAKKKPIDAKTIEEWGVDAAPRLEIVKVSAPGKREAGVIVESVAELVDKLQNEAKVL